MFLFSRLNYAYPREANCSVTPVTNWRDLGHGLTVKRSRLRAFKLRRDTLKHKGKLKEIKPDGS